jgi:hypothetical protein
MNTILSIAVTIVITASFAATADAGPFADREGSGTYTTSNGRTGDYSWRSRREGSTVTKDQSITTEGGRTFEREITATYDKDTGTLNRSVTGPAERTRTSTWSYNPETRAVDRVTTGPAGRSVYSSSTLNPDNRGITTTHTGPGGRTVTAITTLDGEQGRSTTVVGPNGRETSWRASRSRDRESGTIRRSLTGPRGRDWFVDLSPD